MAGIVYWVSVGLTAPFAYIGAWFLNFAVKLALSSTAYALDFITQGWTIARDIANMAFLFILVYLAVTIMLKAETAGTMQTLAWVIAIALVVNFSFFATRVVIDAGNILATQFYNAIESPQNSAAPINTGLTDCNSRTGMLCINGTKDLTASIMGGVNPQTILGGTFNGGVAGANDGGFWGTLISLTIVYIGMGIMFMLLAVSFITAGIKFIMRIVVLWFLIIASPLAFVTAALPKTRTWYFQWQSALINHVFYPVVFLFMFYILTIFMKAVGAGGNNTFVGGNFGTPPTDGYMMWLGTVFAVISIRVAFVVIMIYIALSVSEKIGVLGGEAAKKATTWATGKYFGALGATGRTTAGWAGQRAYESNWLRNRASTGLFSYGLWRGAGRLGTATFDARNIKGAAPLAKAGGVDLGTASDMTFRKGDEARVKRKEATAAALKPSKGKIEETERAVLRGLDDEKRQRLEDAAKAYEEAFKANDGVNSPTTRENLRIARTAFNAEAESVVNEIKKRTGQGNAGKYAESITKKNWANLWKLHSAFITTASSYEAASSIRDPKNDAERLRALISATRKGPAPSTGVTTTATAPATGRQPARAPGTTAVANANEPVRPRPQQTNQQPQQTQTQQATTRAFTREAAERIHEKVGPHTEESVNELAERFAHVVEKQTVATESLTKTVASSQRATEANLSAQKEKRLWQMPQTVKLDETSAEQFKNLRRDIQRSTQETRKGLESGNSTTRREEEKNPRQGPANSIRPIDNPPDQAQNK